MPRKLLQKFLPGLHHLRAYRSLQLLGDWLHNPNLWHLSRRSVSGGVALGLFMAWVPMPMQMLGAAILAIPLRVNLAIAVLLVWVSNPLTLAPMFYFAYRVGAFVLDTPVRAFHFELSLDWLYSGLTQIWRPFLLGCFITGVASAALGFVSMRLFWRYWVLRERGKRRRCPNKPAA